jgi:hypothetical protein
MQTARTYVLLFITLSFPLLVFATAQRRDILLLNGKTYSIQTNPLRPFLEKNPNKIPRSDVTSSSLWRGCVVRKFHLTVVPG